MTTRTTAHTLKGVGVPDGRSLMSFRRACQLNCGCANNRFLGVIREMELLYTPNGKQQGQKGYTHIKCVPVIRGDRYTNKASNIVKVGRKIGVSAGNPKRLERSGQNAIISKAV